MIRRLIVEGSVLDRGISGSARLVLELQAALTNHQAFHVEVLRPPRTANWVNRFRLGRAIRWIMWILVGFPTTANPTGDDVLISPIGVAPLMHRRRTWVMLHDLNPTVRGANYDRGFALIWRVFHFWTVALAGVRFLVSSHDVEDMLLHRVGLPPGRVLRVHWPVGRTLRTMAVEDRDRPGGVDKPPLVLMVGTTEPHKRFPMGLNAVRIARMKSGLDIQLKLVGPAGRGEREISALGQEALKEGWFERLIDIDDARLGQLYGESSVLLVPSLTEGYCLPIVEAQANHCVVVHSHDDTLRETAGGHSVEADPNPGALAEAILRAIRDVGQNAELIEASRMRALSFSWEHIVASL